MLALFAPRTPATDPCHIRQVHPPPELPALWFPSPRRVGPTDVYSNLVYTCQASLFLAHRINLPLWTSYRSTYIVHRTLGHIATPPQLFSRDLYRHYGTERPSIELRTGILLLPSPNPRFVC